MDKKVKAEVAKIFDKVESSDGFLIFIATRVDKKIAGADGSAEGPMLHFSYLTHDYKDRDIINTVNRMKDHAYKDLAGK